MEKIKRKSNVLELPTVSNGDLLAGLAVPGPVALHGCHHIHAVLHLAEDHVLPVQPGREQPPPVTRGNGHLHSALR